MEQYKFGRVNNNLLRNNFIKALKNEDFIEVVNNLDIHEDIKMKYTSQLMEVACESKICRECKGLNNCKYNVKGLYKYPIVENDGIKFVLKKCSYKEKDDYEQDYIDNIYYFEVPKELKEAGFKKIYKDDSNRLETIKKIKCFYDDYLRNKSVKGLYLYGNFGCGKTYFISALFNELAKKGVKSTIVYFPELLRSLKASFNGDKDEYNNRFNQVRYAQLLLLDDIGAEKLSDWARDEVLGSILQYRMESNLPTFLTSNLSLDDLEIHLSMVKTGTDKIKARRIIERIKYLTDEVKMVSKNRRN